MNERTQELIKQFATDLLNRSGYDMREYEPFLEESEKFVKSLIRECAEVVDNDDSSYPYDSFGHKLKQHFGVKE